MECDRCHERPARYHVTRVVNGQTVQELDLCERCAAEQGELPAGPSAEPHMTIHQLLAGLLAGTSPEAGAAVPPAAEASARCPRCGYTYVEFARTGLVGCPECYGAFSDQLDALIGRIHGRSRHEGKVPLRGGASARRQRTLEAMRRELEGAVAREEFEKAAELRDRIRALQSGAEAPAAERTGAPSPRPTAGARPEG